ncbi:C-glycoside deglycosidase beta subunit domain-containing protein [Geodermatophilus sp. SYSU D01119]
MTMTEGTLRPGALTVRDGRLALAVRLPWYRSLPLSCLESIEVAVDGGPAEVRSVGTGDFSGPPAGLPAATGQWDLRDALEVSLEVPGTPGAVHAVEVSLAVRIPYIQVAPGVPLVQHATARVDLAASRPSASPS